MWTALKNLLRSILVGAAVLWIPVAGAQGVEPRSSAPGGRFTFAWPLNEGMLKPRGATTRGAPVVLDTAAGPEWERLRAPAANLERDRRAILAMAGPYRVSFDFLEVVRFDPDAQARRALSELGHRVRLRRRGPGRIHRAPAHPRHARAAAGRQYQRADGGSPLAPGMALPAGEPARVRRRQHLGAA